MKIKTLIVDDEPHAIEIIERYLKNIPEIELAGTCNHAVKAFQILQQNKIDLVFLDIKMPGLTGPDFIRSLKNPPKIIFSTAYQEYALEGFELNAVDYLLKPISFPRFLKAIDKVLSLYKIQTASTSAASERPEQNSDVYLYLKVDRKTIKVNSADIYWIESVRDYIKVVLKNKVWTSKYKIGLLEELLPEDKFARIHRSFIVSLSKIDSFSPYSVEILARELPIGRNYKAECQKKFRIS